MSDSDTEKSYWQGHRVGTERLAEKEQELTVKMAECLELRAKLDDARAQLHRQCGQLDASVRANKETKAETRELRTQLEAIQATFGGDLESGVASDYTPYEAQQVLNRIRALLLPQAPGTEER